MHSDHETEVLKKLHDAFHDVPRPEPLAGLHGAHWPGEVDVFNALDWECVTFEQYNQATEGWIVSEPATVVYLLPRLFRMIFSERRTNDAIHNVTSDIQYRLSSGHQRQAISALLNKAQKDAVVYAFRFIDVTCFNDPDGTTASEIATALGMNEP